jgi:hypothetical protein
MLENNVAQFTQSIVAKGTLHFAEGNYQEKKVLSHPIVVLLNCICSIEQW